MAKKEEELKAFITQAGQVEVLRIIALLLVDLLKETKKRYSR